MTEEQCNAIKYAYADLQGAYQAYEDGDLHGHDWKAHKETLDDMLKAFPFLCEGKE